MFSEIDFGIKVLILRKRDGIHRGLLRFCNEMARMKFTPFWIL